MDEKIFKSDCFYCSKAIYVGESYEMIEVQPGGFIFQHKPCPLMIKRFSKSIVKE